MVTLGGSTGGDTRGGNSTVVELGGGTKHVFFLEVTVLMLDI